MKIKSMTAAFGRLAGTVLTPGPGLTIIHAPNEGGKSTWAAFWRAMLYGIDTRDRDKKGYLADKNRYQPWSGIPMEGEVTLELEGRDITIRRGPRGSTPFGTFSAVYAGTQEPVPGLTADSCGELLTGVGQEVFVRSAFLGAGNMAVTTAPELERRIAALVSSGEEEVSFSQAMGRLKDWKNRRQVNRSVGDIPRLEGELAQVREALEQLEETAGQAALLEGERSALERRRERLSQEAETHRLLARQRLSDRYVQAETDYQSAQSQYAALKRELGRFGALPGREDLKRAQGELQYLKVLEEEIKQGSAALEEREQRTAQARQAARDDLFSELTGDEAVSKAAAEAASCQASVRKAGKAVKWASLMSLISLAGSVIGRLAFQLHQNRAAPLEVFWGVLAGIAVLMAGVGFWALHQKKQARRILTQYGVQTPEELTALAQSYRERCQAADKAAHEEEVIRGAVTERLEKRDAARSDLLDFVHTFAPEVKDMFGCSAALSRALNLEHDLKLARERAEERRRRLEDLSAQGAGQGPEEAVSLAAPERTPEETAQALTRTADRLEQVSARLNQTRGTLRAMGDPAALSARKEELEAALARKRLELEALSAAMEGLAQASALLQERFSPELNRLTGTYLARLTGDRYSAVSLTRELEGFVDNGGVLPRSALFLSRGTVDQLYLAVRLAVCQLCLPEKSPILLDDALTAFDDQRLALALELLRELSEERQILLFTCQSREGAVLDGVPGVTRLEL